MVIKNSVHPIKGVSLILSLPLYRLNPCVRTVVFCSDMADTQFSKFPIFYETEDFCYHNSTSCHQLLSSTKWVQSTYS